MSRLILALVQREARLWLRRKADALLPLLFLAITVTLFGLGARPNDPALAQSAPAVIWVCSLLAMLLGLDRLFREDREDGSLELLQVSGQPLALAVALKLLMHWLMTGLPVCLLAAPLASQLGWSGAGQGTLVLSLVLGTPVLTLIGGFVAALTLGLPRAGLLLPGLVLPLVVPILIFGSGAARLAQSGADPAGPLYFLAAALVLALTLLPGLAAAALRNASD